MVPLAAGGEASLSRRHGKQPVHEIEAVEPETATEAEAGMGFELKWLLDVDDPHHYLALELRNIDSFRFRHPAPQAPQLNPRINLAAPAGVAVNG
ncbi:hypothetical protein CISIN_1g042080mg [Citrus sinensis]|uniref:Uncharacterized protein n=1 Tax=Citrus sinensis TaxID=2711 RepID=A0A067F830_CITSI|nr:hypothetical protein CISIN_1g042080mg [Citrus sinensis]